MINKVTKGEKEKLEPLAWDQPKVVESPVILIILADKSGWQEGHPIFEKNWEEMLKSGSCSWSNGDGSLMLQSLSITGARMRILLSQQRILVFLP